MKNQFFDEGIHARQQVIYQAIRKQVMAEHELELTQAVGWRKFWVKWKIGIITETRYRGIFFLGSATRFP